MSGPRLNLRITAIGGDESTRYLVVSVSGNGAGTEAHRRMETAVHRAAHEVRSAPTGAGLSGLLGGINTHLSVVEFMAPHAGPPKMARVRGWDSVVASATSAKMGGLVAPSQSWCYHLCGTSPPSEILYTARATEAVVGANELSLAGNDWRERLRAHRPDPKNGADRLNVAQRAVLEMNKFPKVNLVSAASVPPPPGPWRSGPVSLVIRTRPQDPGDSDGGNDEDAPETVEWRGNVNPNHGGGGNSDGLEPGPGPGASWRVEEPPPAGVRREVTFYTDGSVVPGSTNGGDEVAGARGGAAVVPLTDDLQTRYERAGAAREDLLDERPAGMGQLLPGAFGAELANVFGMTSTTAELCAVLCAIRFFGSNDLVSLTIKTDSQAAIAALAAARIEWRDRRAIRKADRVVLKAILAAERDRPGMTLTLVHVKGHADPRASLDNAMNDRADKTAKALAAGPPHHRSDRVLDLRAGDAPFFLTTTAENAASKGRELHCLGDPREAVRAHARETRAALMTRAESSQSAVARSYTEGELAVHAARQRHGAAVPDAGSDEAAIQRARRFLAVSREAAKALAAAAAAPGGESGHSGRTETFLARLVSGTTVTLEMVSALVRGTRADERPRKRDEYKRNWLASYSEAARDARGWVSDVCPLCDESADGGEQAVDTQEHFTSCTATSAAWQQRTARAVAAAVAVTSLYEGADAPQRAAGLASDLTAHLLDWNNGAHFTRRCGLFSAGDVGNICKAAAEPGNPPAPSKLRALTSTLRARLLWSAAWVLAWRNEQIRLMGADDHDGSGQGAVSVESARLDFEAACEPDELAPSHPQGSPSGHPHNGAPLAEPSPSPFSSIILSLSYPNSLSS